MFQHAKAGLSFTRYFHQQWCLDGCVGVTGFHLRKPPSICAVDSVAKFPQILAFPVDFTFIIFELPICSLYLSTLLLNLNARKFIRNIPQTSIDLSDMSGDRNNGDASAPIHFVQPVVSTWETDHLSRAVGFILSSFYSGFNLLCIKESASSAAKQVTLTIREEIESRRQHTV